MTRLVVALVSLGALAAAADMPRHDRRPPTVRPVVSALPVKVLSRATRGEHRLPLPRKSVHRLSPVGVGTVHRGSGSVLDWRALAACESSGNWHVNSGNGYYGGLQMDLSFWRTYGGLRFAARPDLASRDEQIAVAERGFAARGSEPWPTCGRFL